MADENQNRPQDPRMRSTDLLMDETTTLASDRAKRINSLHRSIDELQMEENRKRLQISTEIDSLTKKQQELSRTLQSETQDFASDTAKAYKDVNRGLSETISNLASGIKSITLETTKATTNAINQYGKAISEDVGINKQNTIAMSLAQATPIYGYFAAKFMETDVFKNAASKIREKLGSAVSSGMRAVGSKLRIGKSRNREMGAMDASRIPSAQSGGYVEKGGLVNVHAGEIISPMQKIQESQQKHNKDFLERFFDNWKSAQEEKPWQEELTKNIKDMRAALIGTDSPFHIALKKTMLENPVMNKLLLANDIFQNALVKPIRWLFAVRGGYGGEARKAARSSNVFERMVQLMILNYTKMMPKLDAISYYNKVSAETLSGKKLKAPTRETTTRFRQIKEFFTGTGKKDEEVEGFNSILSKLAGGDKEVLKNMKKAGITKPADLLPWRLAKSLGITGANIKARGKEAWRDLWGKEKEEGPAKRGRTAPYRTTPPPIPGIGEKPPPLPPEYLAKFKPPPIPPQKQEQMVDDISSIKKAVASRDEQAAKKKEREAKTEDRAKTKKFRKGEVTWRQKFGKKLKKIGGSIWKWVIIGLGFVKSAFSTALGGISSLVKFFTKGALLTGIKGLFQSGGALATLFTSPWFWGPVGAALVGAGIGTAINKWLINPIINWWEDKQKKKSEAISKELNEKRDKSLGIVRDKYASDKKRMAETDKLKLKADINKAQGKAKYKQRQRLSLGFGSVEWGGEDKLHHIQLAQQKYMDENAPKYLEYSPEERRRVRAEWLTKYDGGFRDRNLLEDPHKYGTKREAAFLSYLIKEGKKETAEERQQRMAGYGYGPKEGGGPTPVTKPQLFGPKKPPTMAGGISSIKSGYARFQSPVGAIDVPLGPAENMAAFLKSQLQQRYAEAGLSQPSGAEWNRIFTKTWDTMKSTPAEPPMETRYREGGTNNNMNQGNVSVNNVSNVVNSRNSQNINQGGGGMPSPKGSFSSGPGMSSSVLHANIR